MVRDHRLQSHDFPLQRTAGPYIGVKRFQTHHDCGVDVTRGLALLFGLGAKALPSWDSRTRWNNLYRGLAVKERQIQADMRTHLIHRPARDILPPLGGARVPPIDPTQLSCRCGGFPGPAEFGAVNPDNGMDRPRSN